MGYCGILCETVHGPDCLSKIFLHAPQVVVDYIEEEVLMHDELRSHLPLSFGEDLASLRHITAERAQITQK